MTKHKCKNVKAGITTLIKLKSHTLPTLSNYVKWPAPPSPYSDTLCPVVHALASFGSQLTQHRWAGVTVHWASGTYAQEWGSTVHRCHISCDAHPIKKGGWTAPPINRSPFQTALCSPTPGSWQQLAARTGHSSPTCQSVHYGVGWSMGVESQTPGAVN